MVLGYDFVVGPYVSSDNIDIVHNQFGSANQRYCVLPHHYSIFRVNPIGVRVHLNRG